MYSSDALATADFACTSAPRASERATVFSFSCRTCESVSFWLAATSAREYCSTARFCACSLLPSIESLASVPCTDFSKPSTPAPASRKVLSASLICLLMVRRLRLKLSLSRDSATTRSRKTSLMKTPSFPYGLTPGQSWSINAGFGSRLFCSRHASHARMRKKPGRSISSISRIRQPAFSSVL